MFKDLGLKRVRLMSYWDIHEPTQGAYDFTELDWQFREAEKATVKVSLAIGIRQPRWPECHQAEWTRDLSSSELRGAINTYLEKVVNRYKASPALDSYQLENEFFIAAFGECQNFDRQRLIDEYDLVKRIDPDHPIIVSLSHNFVGLPTRGPQPDVYGLSIYRRLYSTNYYHGYVTYPIPAWYYTVRAGWIKLWTGQDSIVHEFQMEPWGTKPTENMTIAEQDESITVDDIRGRFGFAKATRIKTVDLWGAEWWYWRKVHFNDPRAWDAVKQELAN